MSTNDSLAAANKYYELLRQGKSPSDAFKEAYPNGIPTKMDQAKDAAKAQQQAGIAQTGGMVGGALAGKAAFDAATGTGWFAAPAATTATTTGATAAGTAGATSAAAPAAAATEAGATTGVSAAGMGSVALPVAAALYGAYRGHKMWNRLKDEGGGTSGAKTGVRVGFKPQNLAIFGTSSPMIGGLMGAVGNQDRWQTEQNRLNALREQGYQGVPELNLSGGRSKQQLIDEAKATGGNVQFAETRNEGTLTPQDIAGYASIIEKAGPQSTLDQRLKLAADALNAGAVREHHGTVDVDWSKLGAQQPQMAQGFGMQQVQSPLVQALTKPQIDAGTARRWRLGRNG